MAFPPADRGAVAGDGPARESERVTESEKVCVCVRERKRVCV